jgi:hypothetical protein
MKEWLSKAWKWLVGGVAGGLVLVAAFFLGRQRRNGEIDLAVAEHDLKRATDEGKKAEAKVVQLSVKQREIAEEILREKVRRAGMTTEWENLDAEEVRRRLRAMGLLK